jgi:D-alanyl-D-alanine carboxypeptidase/D-alanyl-D-alanine-endopeptidase (penicillin-binding protein 4)
VLDVGTGEVLASYSPHAAFNPASNAKLITAVAALRTFGSQHRYLTGLYGRASGDAVGELVLRGQGDPSLEMQDLREMARDLRASGVRKVASIGVDQAYFDDRFTPPAFDDQPDEWAPFRAPVAAVSLNQNTVLFTVRPSETGKTASVSADPPGFVELNGAIRTSGKGDPEKILLSLEPRGPKLLAKLGGTIPANSRAVLVKKRVDDPSLLAGYALRAALKDAGVEVSGDVHLAKSREKRLLAAHRSAPLGELLPALGKDSDNFYAEMLFKALGASTNASVNANASAKANPNNKTGPATFEAGAEAALRVLRDMGAFEEGVVIKNGSGLFDANRSTPTSTAALLRAAYRDAAIAPEFVAHLAIGGVDGTLRSRFRSFGAARAIRAKTGTLDAVAALSGYVLAPAGGAPIAFSIYVNGISGKVGEARQSIDRIVDAIASELWNAR